MPLVAHKSAPHDRFRFGIDTSQEIPRESIREEVRLAFRQHRAFPFYADRDLVARLRTTLRGDHESRFAELKNHILTQLPIDNESERHRVVSDARLSLRIVTALGLTHEALAQIDSDALVGRRFVLVKERRGTPTFFYIPDRAALISHVGQGPQWQEAPTIYLGLNIFDALTHRPKKDAAASAAFEQLLRVEERAIETGYSHQELPERGILDALDGLIDAVIRVAGLAERTYTAVPGKSRPFSARNRQILLRRLDARLATSELDFDAKENLKAIDSLGKLARRYKVAGDAGSLREVVRLLVAASGHDVDQVRNRANVILDRVLAPKEYDAPLATQFHTVRRGAVHHFSFTLLGKKPIYFARIYRSRPTGIFFVEKDLDYTDLDLTYDPLGEHFTATYAFDELGQYDFLVYRRRSKGSEWLLPGRCSGRITVIPELQAELMLEIFPDVHGHTRAYWQSNPTHPGLVYNENGELIRLGRFADITAHLQDLKRQYAITVLYLLGVQKRGSNRQDWAPEAKSPSPFSPVSLTEIEPALGGENEFRELVDEAHGLGLKVIVDIVPHLNRESSEVPDSHVVQCYDDHGDLVPRAATDGRYGSWNDGKLLNYRKLEVWEWLSKSIESLIERFDIDGVRFDSAHAVPVMMKKNNYLYCHRKKRGHEEMVEGSIIVNDRVDDHYVTTGYYDSACRDMIACPFHYYLMLRIEQALRRKHKDFFINIAECYWGRERFLSRSGIIPYNSGLFKICENVLHGVASVSEIYHLYNDYFPTALAPGTELLGILGNHDERRALETFGREGLRAALAFTCFMSNVVMDYEGSAEGEAWRVHVDNIYVNWNHFNYAADRSIGPFYRELYSFYRDNPGKGYLVGSDNPKVAAALKVGARDVWLGVFNFSAETQQVTLSFDTQLPIEDDAFYRCGDSLYSSLTGRYAYYTGRELRVSELRTVVSYIDRVKILKLEKISDPTLYYHDFLRDSFVRLCSERDKTHIPANYAYGEIAKHACALSGFFGFLLNNLIPLFMGDDRQLLKLGMRRALFQLYRSEACTELELKRLLEGMALHPVTSLRQLGVQLRKVNERRAIVFLSAEAEPFSKSGGLANVVYELPRELVELGEDVYVITPRYHSGDQKAVAKMNKALAHYGVRYTGLNVPFAIMGTAYNAGVHHGEVDSIQYFMLDHPELFDGLYWGYTASEKLRRRIAFARAAAETLVAYGLRPGFIFTNDAFAGVFNGLVRSDQSDTRYANLRDARLIHIIHNCGWQYFDSYNRYEHEFDHLRLFDLGSRNAADFCDPVFSNRINCMSIGIRFADRVITVSPSYARQIEIASDGLERLLQNVVGINNALGKEFRARIQKSFQESGFVESTYPLLRRLVDENVELRGKIESRYPEILDDATLQGVQDEVRRSVVTRKRNKLLLQLQRGLAIDPDKVLFAMIHRVVEQKGFQLLLDASAGIFGDLGFQGIVGGPKAPNDERGEELARGLMLLQEYYPQRIAVQIGYQDVSLALLACDVFLMPSMHEPGGISQLEAFSCGAIVVARATGGLRDTVSPIRVYDGVVQGNGFLFTDFSAASFYDAMARCAVFFRDADDALVQQARAQAAHSVHYWDSSARRYVEEMYALREIVPVPSATI